MTCKITIQTVGHLMIVDAAIEDHEGSRRSAWKSDKETTLEETVFMLPEIVSRLVANPSQLVPT